MTDQEQLLGKILKIREFECRPEPGNSNNYWACLSAIIRFGNLQFSNSCS